MTMRSRSPAKAMPEVLSRRRPHHRSRRSPARRGAPTSWSSPPMAEVMAKSLGAYDDAEKWELHSLFQPGFETECSNPFRDVAFVHSIIWASQ